MKQPFLVKSIILLVIGLILASFSSALFIAHADSSDSKWQLSINGLVNHPLNFTLADLEAMPQTTVSAALYCVDYPTTAVTQGNWTGVKLWTLLNETKVLPGAIKVAFYATDGYSTDLIIDAAKSDYVILAYAKDGAPLSEVLRLVVPGHWGYKWIAQVVHIELVDYSFTGKWESLGYSDDGIITQSSLPQVLNPPLPVQTTPPAYPSASPKESPEGSPSIPPITNSTSQSPSTQSKNLNSQNFILIEATTVISIVIVSIVAIALIAIIKTKNSHYKNNNLDFSASN